MSKNNLTPEYLSSLCIPYRKYFNSRRNHLDLLDPGPKSRMKTYRDCSFKIAGAEEWNKLPLSLKRSSSVDLFQKNLKTYLLNKYFRPKIDLLYLNTLSFFTDIQYFKYLCLFIK